MSTHRQSQFELFPRERDSSEQTPSSNLTKKSCVFSMEHLLMFGIAVIVLMVVSFSFGVERGEENTGTEIAGRPAPREEKVVIPVEQADESATKTPQPLVEQKETTIMTASLPAFPALEELDNTDEMVSTPDSSEKKVDKIYTIQVASFRKEKYAKQEAKDLEKKGYEATVLPKGKYSIVCVGKFAQKKEAEKAAKALKKQYKDYLIRSL